MRLLFWSLVLIIPISSKEVESTVDRETVDYCLKYSECREFAKGELETCTGGIVQMFLNDHTLADNRTESTGITTCEKELAVLLNKSIHGEYEKIDQSVFQCISNPKTTSPEIETTQRLLCDAAYEELTIAEQVEDENANSSVECRTAYGEQLQKCELMRGCCPQFDECQNKAEIDSGIRLREKLIAQKYEKCMRTEGNITVSDSTEDLKPEDVEVRFAPRRGRGKESEAPGTPTATPVPRIQTSLINGHGRSLIHSYKLAKNRKSLKAQKRKAIRRAKAMRRNRKAKGKAKKTKAETVELTTLSSPTTSPPPPSTQPTDEERRTHDSSKQTLDEQNKTNRQAAWSDVPSAEQKATDSHESSSAQVVLNRLLCTHYMECEAILEKREHECTQQFGSQSEFSGIEDPSVRSIFLNNSNTSDTQIRRKCLENVDAESQRHLVYLKTQKEIQDRECTMSTKISEDALEIDQCEDSGLLTEFSKLQPMNDIMALPDLDSCRQHLSGFREKCQKLRQCCPQKITCEETNHSAQAKKFSDILTQLKMEQNLCEKRLTRVHDGLIVNNVHEGPL